VAKQMSLFDDEPVEDKKPPETKLARKVKGAKAQILAVFSRSRVPLTANEAAEQAVNCEIGKRHRMTETYRKRCRELVRDGLLIECPKRPCSLTGESVTTFKTLEDDDE